MRAGILVAADVQLVRARAAVAAKTTGWLIVSHNVGLTVMVGGKVTSTMSFEKSMIFPSMPDGFVNETGSLSTPHSNQT